MSEVVGATYVRADEDGAWLHTVGESWSEPEQLALVMARHEGYVDNVGLRGLTGQHPADVTKVLGGLRDRGLLQMIGGGRGARYELGPAAADALSQLYLIPPEEPLASIGAERSSGCGQPSSGDNQGNSGGKRGNSGDLGEDSGGSDAELLEISRVARERRRLEPVDRDRMIDEVLSSLNKSDDFILAVAELTGGESPRAHYVHQPFQRERHVAVTSVNNLFAEPIARGVDPT